MDTGLRRARSRVLDPFRCPYKRIWAAAWLIIWAAIGAGECGADLTLQEILAHGGTVGATRTLMSPRLADVRTPGIRRTSRRKRNTVVGGRTTGHRGDAISQRKRNLI